jgi:hypothetical protein
VYVAVLHAHVSVIGEQVVSVPRPYLEFLRRLLILDIFVNGFLREFLLTIHEGFQPDDSLTPLEARKRW